MPHEIIDRGLRFAFAALLIACNGKGESESESTAAGSDTGEGVGTTSSAPTTGGEEERFGFACVGLHQDESVEGDPFLGTAEIRVRLNYEPCLQDYYLDKHPEMRTDGTQGPAVFEAWKQRLCTEPVPGRIDCEVQGFQQVLMTNPPAYYLEVTYTTPAPERLNGGTLLWGPAPLSDFAECAEGLQPFVNLSGLADVSGRDKDGKLLWQVQSFSDKRNIIKLTAGGCIQANVQPVSG